LLKSNVLKEVQRSLVMSFLDTIILAELRNPIPLGSYDIIEFVHRKFGFLISPGTIYSLMYSMERKGLLRGVEVQAKRTYTLTDKGVETINAILESRVEIQMFMRAILAVDQAIPSLLSQ
jgi:DNA-binding PadR family transcriptional regulator